ncbi:extensin-like domain-containing protein [Celeribacter sp. ULVN23_4]
MIGRGVIALALSLSVVAPAVALDRSPIPLLRPGSQPAAVPIIQAPHAISSHRPILRPGSRVVSAPQIIATGFASPLPKLRPTSRVATSAPPAQSVTYGRSGAVCGVKDIRGQRMSPIVGAVSGCGVKEPVQITEVAGVRLSTPAVVDCTTAKALRTWINKGADPVIGRLGGGLAQLDVAASYVCRPRNNQAGAKISEHGLGHAIDVSALRLKNGMVITVRDGWNDKVQGKILRKLHKSACGPFGTVLGPESDQYHKDHFHFDTARYRSGSYCR